MTNQCFEARARDLNTELWFVWVLWLWWLLWVGSVGDGSCELPVTFRFAPTGGSGCSGRLRVSVSVPTLGMDAVLAMVAYEGGAAVWPLAPMAAVTEEDERGAGVRCLLPASTRISGADRLVAAVA